MFVYVNYSFILIIFLTIALSGCKLRKDTHTAMRMDRQAEAQVAGTTSWVQLMGSDSTSRYWSFTSDSSFFFHPDYGLRGLSGSVSYIERNAAEIKSTQWKAAYDSVGREHSDMQHDAQISWTRYVGRNWYWLLLITAIVVGIYWWRRWW